jgi:hypothetical protein
MGRMRLGQGSRGQRGIAEMRPSYSMNNPCGLTLGVVKAEVEKEFPLAKVKRTRRLTSENPVLS